MIARMSEIRLKSRADLVITGRVRLVSSAPEIRYPTVSSRIIWVIYTISTIVECVHKGYFPATNRQLDFRGERPLEAEVENSAMTLHEPPMPGDLIKAYLTHQHDGPALFHWSGLKRAVLPKEGAMGGHKDNFVPVRSQVPLMASLEPASVSSANDGPLP